MSKKKAVEKYKASSSMCLTGGFKNIAEAKSYHGLLVLAQMNGWKYDDRGEMRIRLSELHKLTRHACETWQEYLGTLQYIRDNLRLDWSYLSKRSDGKFNREGDTPILSEVYADLDLSGQFQELVFRIPTSLLLDVIAPVWFGQVNPEILFSIKSTYAFNAYLYACLTVVEKDNYKDEFWSKALPINEWKQILGAPDDIKPYRFRSNVLRRTEKQIAKTTKNTEEPIEVLFTDEHCSSGLYQMYISRLKRPDSSKAGNKKRPPEQFVTERDRITKEQWDKVNDRQNRVMNWYLNHPKKAEIDKKLRMQNVDLSGDIHEVTLAFAGYEPPPPGEL